MSKLPEYLEKQIEEYSQEIIEGFDTLKNVLPSTTKIDWVNQLEKDYVQAVGYLNGLRESDIQDNHKIKVLGIKRAINHFKKELK